MVRQSSWRDVSHSRKWSKAGFDMASNAISARRCHSEAKTFAGLKLSKPCDRVWTQCASADQPFAETRPFLSAEYRVGQSGGDDLVRHLRGIAASCKYLVIRFPRVQNQRL